MQSRLEKNSGTNYDLAFINETIKSMVNCSIRSLIDPGKGYYRSITPERKKGIDDFYEQAALTMYKGFVQRMEKYAKNGNNEQKSIAAAFYEIQK